MNEAPKTIENFAEKIAGFSPKKGMGQLGQLGRVQPLKGVRLSFSNIEHPKKNVEKGLPGSVQALFLSKPSIGGGKPLYEAAFGANKCCRSQDLHLMKFNQIYEEKRLLCKEIIDWKLPKSSLFFSQLRHYVDQMKFLRNVGESRHQITRILVGELAKKKREEELGRQEQMELDQMQKEKRNYQHNKTII